MRKRYLAVPAVLLASVSLAACGSGGSGQQAYSSEVKSQGRDTGQLDKNQPVPQFSRSEIRQELIDIEAAQADGVQSTTFFMPNGDQGGEPQGSCASIGAPVPVTDQLTNPSQVIKDNANPINNGGGNTVVDQEDPAGVYTGDGQGTYVVCVNPSDGSSYVQYWEGPVRVVFGPATWNKKTDSPQLTGATSSIFKDLKANGGSGHK